MPFNLTPMEEELIQNCIKGDRYAQKELYNKYKNAMYTISLRITNNTEDASECLQDAFLQVFRDIKQFNRLSTLGAWIKTIVIRTSIKKTKLSFLTESLDAVVNEDLIEWPHALNGDYLQQAIDELPNGYKLVFILTEVEGYTHKETAEMLKISVGTSKSQLFHAKKMLQKKLRDII